MSKHIAWWRAPGERVMHSFATAGPSWLMSACGEVQWTPYMIWVGYRPFTRPVGVMLDAAAACGKNVPAGPIIAHPLAPELGHGPCYVCDDITEWGRASA